MSRVATLLLAVFLLAACGGGDAGTSDSATGSEPPQGSTADGTFTIEYSTYGRACTQADSCVTDVTLDYGNPIRKALAITRIRDMAAAGSGRCAAGEPAGFEVRITRPNGRAFTVDCLNKVKNDVAPLVRRLRIRLHQEVSAG